MKSYLGAADLRVKVDNYYVGIGIFHEMFYLHFYGKGKGLWQVDRHEYLCWYRVLIHFILLVVNGVNFESPYEKVCELKNLGDVIVIIQGNNRRCTQTHVHD